MFIDNTFILIPICPFLLAFWMDNPQLTDHIPKKKSDKLSSAIFYIQKMCDWRFLKKLHNHLYYVMDRIIFFLNKKYI